MLADRKKYEVVVIGAGPAGVSCAYVLAKAGVDVLILERGQYSGAKNMFGGIFFSDQMSKLIPNFYTEAPVERFLAKRRYSMLVDDSEIAFGFEPEGFKKPPYNHSFIVRRSVFDRWFAGKAEERGATLICGVTVKDLVWDGRRVVGVTAGPGDDNTVMADVVVCAEGANSIVSEKAGLRNRLSSRSRSIGVKEVIELPRDVINERFGLTGREGASCEYFGGAVAGQLGNGFIYTNMESLSVGVAVLISELYGREEPISPNALLDGFKRHPSVQPLIRGGRTLEYSAHLIPADGHKHIPKLSTDGLVLVGDAAGLVTNTLCHEGVNMAMASGMMAAETILENRKKRRYGAKALGRYERLLKDSFVLTNLKDTRNFLDVMRTHHELINDYPHALRDALTSYFSVSDVPKKVVNRNAFRRLRSQIGLGKMARTFASLLRSGG